jgi:hypothetical protein
MGPQKRHSRKVGLWRYVKSPLHERPMGLRPSDWLPGSTAREVGVVGAKVVFPTFIEEI